MSKTALDRMIDEQVNQKIQDEADQFVNAINRLITTPCTMEYDKRQKYNDSMLEAAKNILSSHHSTGISIAEKAIKTAFYNSYADKILNDFVNKVNELKDQVDDLQYNVEKL